MLYSKNGKYQNFRCLLSLLTYYFLHTKFLFEKLNEITDIENDSNSCHEIILH